MTLLPEADEAAVACAPVACIAVLAGFEAAALPIGVMGSGAAGWHIGVAPTGVASRIGAEDTVTGEWAGA